MRAASYARPLAWKSAWQFKGRAVLSIAAIAIGVAISYAVHLINATAVEEFTRGLRALSGSADLTVRSSRSGVPIETFARLAAHPIVATASPLVELDATLIMPLDGQAPAAAGKARTARDGGTDQEPHAQRRRISVIGVDALRAGVIAPALLGESPDQLDVLRDDTIFLGATLAGELRMQVGTVLMLEVGGKVHRFRVAGWLNAQAPATAVAVIDIAAAQTLVGVFDRITRVDVRLRSDATVAAAIRQLSAVEDSLSIEQPQQLEQAGARLSRAYRVNLMVLALMALFTGALLVFSCEALLASRRRAELALLRVLGMTRSEVVRQLLALAARLGVIGSVIGLLLGALAAHLVVRYAGADLGAGYFQEVRPSLSFSIGPALVLALCGLAAALAGAAMPAIDAVRIAPAQALKSTPDLLATGGLRRTALRWSGAAIFLLLALVLVRVPAVFDLPLGGYGAIACVLMAALVSLPPMCAWLLRLVPPMPGLSIWLATTRLRRAPLEASISLAAMVAAVSLTVAMAIMVGSFRGSLLQWLDRLLPADLYLRASSPDDRPRLGAADQARIAAIEGVRVVEFLRMESVSLDPTRPRVSLLARDVQRESIAERLPLLEWTAIPPGAVPVWPSEVAAGLYGLKVGQTIALPLAGARAGAHPGAEPVGRADADSAASREVRGQPVFVAGIWRDYGRPQGAIVIERAQYIALTGDRAADDAAIWFDRPDDAARITPALAWLGDQVRVATPGEIKRASVRIFDRTFAVTYALEAIAVLIGIAGLSAGIGASVAMRRREIGMLRHLGMSRRQLVALLVSEGVALGAVGALIGTATGAVLSWILIEVVNRQSFQWGMDMHWPVPGLLGFVGVLLAVAALSAGASARQVMHGEPARAVREDW